jgi:Flp pilus assembly protein TadB
MSLRTFPVRDSSLSRLFTMVAVSIAVLLVFAVLPIQSTRADEPATSEPATNQPAADVTAAATESSLPPIRPESAKKLAAPAAPLSPEKFRDVDDAAKLLIWLVVSCGLGLFVLLCVIVLGAKRMRRLTQSKSLKSKYDELEFLRLKHRRETDGLPAPDEPKTEIH